MTRPDVDRLVQEGMLERVQPDRAGPRRLLDQARRHLRSPQELREADPSLAYAALYDAGVLGRGVDCIELQRSAHGPGAEKTAYALPSVTARGRASTMRSPAQ